jgi:hypothetical protein
MRPHTYAQCKDNMYNRKPACTDPIHPWAPETSAGTQTTTLPGPPHLISRCLSHRSGLPLIGLIRPPLLQPARKSCFVISVCMDPSPRPTRRCGSRTPTGRAQPHPKLERRIATGRARRPPGPSPKREDADRRGGCLLAPSHAFGWIDECVASARGVAILAMGRRKVGDPLASPARPGDRQAHRLL